MAHFASASAGLGDKQQVDVKTDYSLMTEEERMRKAMELIGVIKEITGPKPRRPPLRYIPEEADDVPEPGGIGGRSGDY